MKFLCMIYFDERKVAEMPEAELRGIVDECMTYSEQLRRSGHYIAANALLPTPTGRTLRGQGEKLIVTDGPFAETREQLGGFYLIEAQSLEEAERIAAKIPPGRLGGVEVRQVREWE
ncbi:MAG: dehydrogenase [Pseudomonas sp.]|uniref:YciI family protein n=1 Tax=Pseudomonas sp. TaxID=306 RepID=UPI000CC10E31|nr:YciI family protein [Pseudomonas sp.]PJI48569.1 MAG: dehydrogenase [Pseudomonas sp.]